MPAVTYSDVVSSLWRSFLVMGGCFFDCFRVRNANPALVSNPDPTPSTVEASEKIHISSLFASEEKKECIAKEKEDVVPQVGRSDLDDSILEEVQLLKACGTLPETPAEIRKAVKFSDQVEKSGMKMPMNALQSSHNTTPAVRTDGVSPETFESAHSVFDSSPETPDDKHRVEFMAGYSDKIPRSMMKASPYATPIMITDDMQTPGTVYATSMKSLTKGNAQIRSQYVYTVSNHIDGKCQLQDLEEDQEGENVSQPGEVTPPPVVEPSQKPVNEETLGDATLSSWLKPQEASSIKKPNVGKALGERPIIGLVATHWNEQEETPHVHQKWWDGNGIPNSTTKYKEDQKVCWHATPFEERLEKALSEETCVPQRKPISGAPIIFEEVEGQEDTATSQLKTVPKSVVSF